MRRLVRAFGAITIQAFKEGIRERTLYNLFFVTLFLLGIGYLAALLVYGHQERVLLHLGIFVNSLSIYGVAVSAGVRSLRTELDSRTAYLPLSRPVPRSLFYFGKWSGIILFLVLNLFLLEGILAMGVIYIGGAVTLAFWQAALLTLVESALLAALSLFLSLFFRPGVSAMMAFTYGFLAHNHEQLRFLKQKGEGGLFSFLMQVTPDAQAWLMDTRIYYEQPLKFGEWALRSGYGLGWTMMFLLLGNAVFYRKNL
jgi:ABC-type transport system involved in multi-copper enzyme maturation permease subunit